MGIAGCQSNPAKRGEVKELSPPAVEIETQQTEDKPNWEAICSAPQAEFSVEFSSQSGAVTEDDMTVAIRWPDGSHTPIPAKPAWFTQARNVISDTGNLCTTIVGHRLPGRRVLLWFLRNDRPNYDQLQLTLLDVNRKRVLDIQNDIGIDLSLFGAVTPAIRSWRRKP